MKMSWSTVLLLCLSSASVLVSSRVVMHPHLYHNHTTWAATDTDRNVSVNLSTVYGPITEEEFLHRSTCPQRYSNRYYSQNLDQCPAADGFANLSHVATVSASPTSTIAPQPLNPSPNGPTKSISNNATFPSDTAWKSAKLTTPSHNRHETSEFPHRAKSLQVYKDESIAGERFARRVFATRRRGGSSSSGTSFLSVKRNPFKTIVSSLNNDKKVCSARPGTRMSLDLDVPGTKVRITGEYEGKGDSNDIAVDAVSTTTAEGAGNPEGNRPVDAAAASPAPPSSPGSSDRESGAPADVKGIENRPCQNVSEKKLVGVTHEVLSSLDPATESSKESVASPPASADGDLPSLDSLNDIVETIHAIFKNMHENEPWLDQVHRRVVAVHVEIMKRTLASINPSASSEIEQPLSEPKDNTERTPGRTTQRERAPAEQANAVREDLPTGEEDNAIEDDDHGLFAGDNDDICGAHGKHDGGIDDEDAGENPDSDQMVPAAVDKATAGPDHTKVSPSEEDGKNTDPDLAPPCVVDDEKAAQKLDSSTASPAAEDDEHSSTNLRCDEPSPPAADESKANHDVVNGFILPAATNDENAYLDGDTTSSSVAPSAKTPDISGLVALDVPCKENRFEAEVSGVYLVVAHPADLSLQQGARHAPPQVRIVSSQVCREVFMNVSSEVFPVSQAKRATTTELDVTSKGQWVLMAVVDLKEGDEVRVVFAGQEGGCDWVERRVRFGVILVKTD
ncbi:uncharacterized protein [Littorina saxatilis]|uniref:Uncharacterized protein n=1 Tax=Littorina saxatilis TaxID=31220 RepID=A0AAN9GPL1_9CAEN